MVSNKLEAAIVKTRRSVRTYGTNRTRTSSKTPASRPPSDLSYTADTAKSVSAGVLRPPRQRSKSAFELLAEQDKLAEPSTTPVKPHPTPAKPHPTPAKPNPTRPESSPTRTKSPRSAKRKSKRVAVDQSELKSRRRDGSSTSAVVTPSKPKRLSASALTFLHTDIGDPKFQLPADKVVDVAIEGDDSAPTTKRLVATSVFANVPRTPVNKERNKAKFEKKAVKTAKSVCLQGKINI